jgi:hypothetical protein
MVLLHGGFDTGAERSPTNGPEPQGPVVPSSPTVKFSKKAAPFKRNDTMLEEMPAGVVHFPVAAFRTISPTRPASSASGLEARRRVSAATS